MKSGIISRLIEIEENAQEITKSVQEKETGLQSLIQQKCDEIENRLKEDFEKKAAKINSDKQKEAESQILAIKHSSVDRHKKLEGFYEENHREWEEEIFNSITGG